LPQQRTTAKIGLTLLRLVTRHVVRAVAAGLPIILTGKADGDGRRKRQIVDAL
jgi:hypothetical protein